MQYRHTQGLHSTFTPSRLVHTQVTHQSSSSTCPVAVFRSGAHNNQPTVLGKQVHGQPLQFACCVWKGVHSMCCAPTSPLLRSVVQRVVADGPGPTSPLPACVVGSPLASWALAPVSGPAPCVTALCLVSRLRIHPDGVRQVVLLRSSEFAMSQSHVLREDCCRQPFLIRPHCATRQDATHTQV